MNKSYQKGVKEIPWAHKGVRVAVIGDVILDEYIEGVVQRISPEAPVPVHQVQHSFVRAGGAANAAANIKSLGGEPVLIGVIGEDEAGRKLTDVMESAGMDTSSIIKTPGKNTIRKTRILTKEQQLIRLDWEKKEPLNSTEQDAILQGIKNCSVDVILLSDYGKGMFEIVFLQQIMDIAKKRNLPVVVDPKGTDFKKYRGTTLMTPNRKEFDEAAAVADQQAPLTGNPAEDQEKIDTLQKYFGLEETTFAITLGADGIYLKEGKQLHHLPARTVEVFDVSGAGDTVAAVFALAYQSDPRDAAEIANIAGSLAVSKKGTQPVFLEELINKVHSAVASPSEKMLALEELQKRRATWKDLKKKVVFTNGCFDILHPGHVHLLAQAKSWGDILIVGLNTDRSIQKLKGPERPVQTLEDRMIVLAGLAAVDYVVPFDEDTPKKLIDSLLPDVLVKGSDYQLEQIVGRDAVEKNGGVVKTVELIKDRSTTRIIAKLQ